MTATRVLGIRLTDEERATIHALADKEGVSDATFAARVLRQRIALKDLLRPAEALKRTAAKPAKGPKAPKPARPAQAPKPKRPRKASGHIEVTTHFKQKVSD
jgi:hypothetical protein